jgi:translation initiation factor 5A
MADMDEFETVQDTASKVVPAQASAIRKGGHIVIKGRPCKVVDMSTSKTGKHGHAKVHFIALDIFTGKKLEELCPSTHNIEVPIVGRKDFPLIDITDDGYCSLLLESGETKDDLKLPGEELGKKIRDGFDGGKDLLLTALSAMGEEAIITCREDK